MLERDLRDGILTLRLAHGKASVLDLELCESLRNEVVNVAERNDIRAVILTGTGSIFSAGVDLPRLISAGGDYVGRFLEALDSLIRALFTFPRPLVTAANGHAIAGGAILSFCGDYRLMSGGRIGMTELLVGVPFPRFVFEVARFAIPPQHFQSMIYLGKTVEAETARDMGIIDEFVPEASLLSRAEEIATQLAAVPRDVFAMTKHQMREPYLHPLDVDVESSWSDPATHKRIREYMERVVARRS
jgi:enoyl-CoA hydratase